MTARQWCQSSFWPMPHISFTAQDFLNISVSDPDSWSLSVAFNPPQTLKTSSELAYFPPSPASSSRKFAIVPQAWAVSSADSASHLHSLISAHLYPNKAITAMEMFVVFFPSTFKHLQETFLIGCCGKYTHAHRQMCTHKYTHARSTQTRSSRSNLANHLLNPAFHYSSTEPNTDATACKKGGTPALHWPFWTPD